MWPLSWFKAIITAIAGAGVVAAQTSTSAAFRTGSEVAGTIAHEWTHIDYAWTSEAQRQAYTSDQYIVANNIVTGVKMWRGEYFVTVPRWLPGVPSTLNRVIVVDVDVPASASASATRTATATATASVLAPFPSWEWQTIDAKHATRTATDGVPHLQYVQSMEIDNTDIMWIVDVGRVNLFAPADAMRNIQQDGNRAKLVLYNLRTETVVRVHVFAATVVSPTTSFLNDIVVDSTRRVAYISDASLADVGGLVVYDFVTDTSRRWNGPGTRIERGVVVTIPLPTGKSDGKPVKSVKYANMRTPVDGIALTPDASTLVYLPLTGHHVWSLPTAVLRHWLLTPGVSDDDVAAHAVDHGRRHSVADGATMDANGRLYYGEAGLYQVFRSDAWATTSATVTTSPTVSLSAKQLPVDNLSFNGVPLTSASARLYDWCDTFAWDNAVDDDNEDNDGTSGALIVLSNRLEHFFAHTLHNSSVTSAADGAGGGSYFRIVRLPVGRRGYNADMPPFVPSGDDHDDDESVAFKRKAFVLAAIGTVVGSVAMGACMAWCLCARRRRRGGRSDIGTLLLS